MGNNSIFFIIFLANNKNVIRKLVLCQIKDVKSGELLKSEFHLFFAQRSKQFCVFLQLTLIDSVY
jgi:hypothetical protein